MEAVANKAIEAMQDLPQKIEMDLSYQVRNESQESGVYSNGSTNANSASASADSSWEHFPDEIVDPEIFDPPVKSSSGLVDRKLDCNISTIDGTLATSRIGLSLVKVLKNGSKITPSYSQKLQFNQPLVESCKFAAIGK